MIKKYLLLVTLCLESLVFAQQSAFKIPDTLRNKDYDYLFGRLEESGDDDVKQSLYLKSFLSKAKSEKNLKEIVNGYKNYLYHSPENLKLIYADSMVYAAKKSQDNTLIGAAYLSKGITYYVMKKHNQALDNYLIANTYISKTDDKYLIYKVKYNIANIKYYLRFYDEAISLFTECIDYFKDNNTDGYLNSLHLLGLCYNRIGNYGLCTDVNKKGVLECKRLDNDEMLPYFIHSEGINQCFKNNYASAIAKINSSLPVIRKNKDFANEAVGYFYIGKSYWNLNKPETAVYYFKKVDAIFANKGYIRADLLQNYKLLMKYYKSKNNPEREHYYSGQLIKAYGILVNKFEYLSGRIHKEFDIKEVVLQNENIQKMLDNRKYNDAIFIVVVTFLFLSLLFFVYRHFKNKRVYKQKFEELMNKSVTNTKTEPKTATAGIEVVDEEKAAVILKQLKRFEDHKKFIGKDLTSIKLAVAFRCDPKYLSKIIFLYRGKKFKDYINDLKIDYVISLMKEDIKVSRYSNIALAEEGGFSRTKRFTNAFFSRTGMPTTYFANELAKGQAEL